MERDQPLRYDRGFGARYNVIAAFAEEERCLAALDTLASTGVPQAAIAMHRPGDGPACAEVVELEAEMGDETGDSWGVLSGAQARGAFIAALTLGVVGAALGLGAALAWAYLIAPDPRRLDWLVVAGGVFGLAGATIGLVLGGSGLGRRQAGQPDRGDRPEVAERDVLVTVELGDPAAAERTARLLRFLGAERVHCVNGDGVPLPPQAQRPRPADPEGWWWSNAGHG
jgi:hypothetical protein